MFKLKFDDLVTLFFSSLSLWVLIAEQLWSKQLLDVEVLFQNMCTQTESVTATSQEGIDGEKCTRWLFLLVSSRSFLNTQSNWHREVWRNHGDTSDILTARSNECSGDGLLSRLEHTNGWNCLRNDQMKLTQTKEERTGPERPQSN